ncbi:MAG TPA: MFS transporter, partial [Hyphomonadaceae bacterium]
MTIQAESAAAPRISGAAVTVALCFGVMVIEGFDIQAMGVAAPALGPELKLSREVLGQALSASNIGLVIGAILGGWLADVFGRKPVLIGAVVIFGLFTLMTMQATSFEMLFAARLLTGLGFGGALPNVMAIAADVSDGKRRGSTAAMMFCGMPVGGSTVALLSWLGYQGEWRPLFLIGGIIPLILAPLLLLFMKETQKPEKGAVGSNLPWLAAIPLGVAFWYLLDQAGRMPGAGSIGGVVAPWLGGVLGLLGAYMIVHRGPLFGGGRSLPSILLWFTFSPTLLILYLVLNWLPTLVAAKGFQADASLASVLFNVFSVVGALCFGPLVDRFGLRWPITLGFLALVG